MKHPEEFDTTEELRDFVVHTIRSTGLCKSLKNEHPEVYDFFLSLFQRHPEKERKEVALTTDISIRRFPKAKPQAVQPIQDHQFFLHRSNGTEDSISWVSCVKGAINPVGKRLNWAMRQSIEGQIREFRAAHPNTPCEFCHTYENRTVDHIKKFRDLKDEFLNAHPNHPTEFGKNELAQEIFRPEDAAFETAWQEYHRTHASLRILCKPCNMKLDNYGAFHI